MADYKLSWKEEAALQTLIETSISTRYTGELEKRECPKDLTISYKPPDAGQIRDLLQDLWGDTLTQQTIDDYYDNITKYGLEVTKDGPHIDWPNVSCEEDEDAAEEERMRDLDRDDPIAWD